MSDANGRTGSRTLGRRIVMLRGTTTQDELVRRMTALSPGHEYKRAWLSLVETGRRDLRSEHASVLARALGVSVPDLYGPSGNGHEEPAALERLLTRYRGRIADEDLAIVETLLERLAQP